LQARWGALLFLGTCWFVFLAGCLVNKDPLPCQDLRGVVATISRAAENEGSILVEEADSYGRAVLRVTPCTSFFRKVSFGWERVAFSDLQEGEWIEACFGGPVMESYPIQVVVRQVVILDVP
jgi:hypothetical protein